MLSDQEKSLTERVFKDLLEYINEYVISSHKLYLKLDNSNVKRYYCGFIIAFHLPIIIWIIGIILSKSLIELELDSNYLFFLFILGIFLIPIFLNTRLKVKMNNKTLLNLYFLSKKIKYLLVIKLKSIMEDNLIHSFSNYSEFRVLRNRMDKKVRSIYNINHHSFIRLLRIMLILFFSEILIILIIIFLSLNDSTTYSFGFLVFIVAIFSILMFQRDFDKDKIKYKVRINKLLKFINYIIEHEFFSSEISIKYIGNYYFYDFPYFKKIVKCIECDQLIEIDSLSQEVYYCSKCNRDFELNNVMVDIIKFNLSNQCIKCGYKTHMKIYPPYNKEIICEYCGYNRGKLYPPMYIRLFSKMMGENERIGIIFSSHNYNSEKYHFILYYNRSENILIPISNKHQVCMLLRISLEKFKNLIDYTSNYYDWVEKSIENEKKSFYIPQKLTDPDKSEQFFNSIKGSRLEDDIRRLLQRRDNYKMMLEGTEVDLSVENRKFMIQESCWEEMQTRTKEIDIIGQKEDSEKIMYVLGECKYQNREISIKEIKKFIITTNILAGQIQKQNNDKSKDIFFHLIIVSYSGFPLKNMIESLLLKYWNHTIDKIKDGKIELLEYADIIRLFKEYKISTNFYTHRI